MYDLIVIGGGPAGITAAAIAINRRLETLIVAERWGGQTTYFMDLEDADVHDMIYAPDVRHLVTAQDLLEDESVTAGPDETLPQLFENFRAHRARDLVVLNEQTRTILGIVEQRDVLRAMHVEQTGQPPPAGH